MFRLDPRLEADTTPLVILGLCRILLATNAAWPWLVLVPEVAEVSEITDLSDADQQRLWQEVGVVTRALQAATGAHKMNVATLGNIVRQLHVHVVARFEGDPAWPGPIWGSGHNKAWATDAQTALTEALRERLSSAPGNNNVYQVAP